jgi:glucosamine--fructose-6-phosphate aminotransferase (isomerizing)
MPSYDNRFVEKTMKDFAYDAQLAAIPQTVSDILARPDLPPLDPSRLVVFAGIGTSLHAARVAADWVTRLTRQPGRALAVDAHDLGTGAVPLTGRETVVSISHRGYKIYPRASLDRARDAGCVTVAVVGEDAPEQNADAVVRTCRNETAGTFSVSYLATLAALARLVAPWDGDGAFGQALADLPPALAATLAFRIAADVAAGLTTRGPILITGFADDLVTAQEAALKIKEGAWMWTEAMSPEFALHGTPASFTPAMGALVILPARDDGGRSRLLIDVLKRLGLTHVRACGAQTGALSFAAPPHPLLRAPLAILPFHRLTSQLAHLRDTDPDTLHGHREPWAGVMTGLTL